MQFCLFRNMPQEIIIIVKALETDFDLSSYWVSSLSELTIVTNVDMQWGKSAWDILLHNFS